MTSKALVVFSGGQDSTTCLYWAKKQFDQVEAICFDYGQRHTIELDSARTIAKKSGTPLKMLKIDTFKQLGANALLDHETKIIHTDGELPNTFVPGRNLIFMTYAAAWAYQKKIPNLITGVCEADYSGYPDCRKNTMESLQQSISLGMEFSFTIHTPLMDLSKAETVTLAQEVGGLEALAWSHTCYEGQFPPCGVCPSCLLRQKGFDTAGVIDPLITRASQNNEGAQ
ncbi:MAG: 7-cyano-7-deazaguanine synthase QueC [Fibrobacterales bacterium]